MKRITAIIKPFKLDDVREALSDKGISGKVSAVRKVTPNFTAVQSML